MRLKVLIRTTVTESDSREVYAQPAENERTLPANRDLLTGDLRQLHRPHVLATLTALSAFMVVAAQAHAKPDGRPTYRSPIDVAFSPDGSLLAAADPTWGGVVFIDPKSRTVVRELGLKGDPAHVLWSGTDRVLVSEGRAGSVAEVDARNGSLIRRLTPVRRATGLARTHDGRVLLVCDRGLNRVAFVDLETGEVTKTVGVVREPGFIASTRDDRYAVVGNKLPRSEDARLPEHGAEVSIIDLTTGGVRNVRLPGGSSIVRQIAISPDNRWAYVIHQAGRANTMVTQLDRGWVMTNCTSIIDIAEAKLYTTFLLDKDGEGAANPWGVAVSPDGSTMWATIAGISQLAKVDLQALHALLADDVSKRTSLHRDLSTMGDFLTRTTVSSVEGIRGIALSPDGNTLAMAAYFEGKVLLVDSAGGPPRSVALEGNPAEDDTRKGERLYNSGKNCYQQWLSCATCHEGGRMDGLNWDLLNDGQGNPKNTKSHVLSALTPPTNATGCRENALVSTRAGYSYIEFRPASEQDIVVPTYAYIQSVSAEPSPYLGADGKLTAGAVEGRKIFESSEAGCSECHRPPLFTNMRRHHVGTRRPAPLGPDNSSWDEGGYDVPTLVELWRTAPYLHLGLAITVKDVVTTYNPDDKHGKTSHLGPEQIDQLVEYLLQIGPTEEEEGAPGVDAVAGSDAGASAPTPGGGGRSTDDPIGTETGGQDMGGGCLCHIDVSAGGPMKAPFRQTTLVGMALLLLTLWRRRRASPFNETQGQSQKGQRR